MEASVRAIKKASYYKSRKLKVKFLSFIAEYSDSSLSLFVRKIIQRYMGLRCKLAIYLVANGDMGLIIYNNGVPDLVWSGL